TRTFSAHAGGDVFPRPGRPGGHVSRMCQGPGYSHCCRLRAEETARLPNQGKGSGVEYLALKDGQKTIVHLMNTEPVPMTFRVSGRGLPESAEGRLTS